jgi:hypothetical protein
MRLLGLNVHSLSQCRCDLTRGTIRLRVQLRGKSRIRRDKGAKRCGKMLSSCFYLSGFAGLVASFMRRIGVCEERGSGVDKVVFQTELYLLPAPLFETTDEHTCAVLFSHREFKEMDKDDRVRACYLHACLKYLPGWVE